jgi:hypothetical protein
MKRALIQRNLGHHVIVNNILKQVCCYPEFVCLCPMIRPLLSVLLINRADGDELIFD